MLTSHRPIPRVLTIAGTDPTGGAGVQADLKSILAAGGYGMSVITALVAQNTQGVRSIFTPPVEFLREQLSAVSEDVEIDAIKIGMLGTVDIANTVADWLSTIDAQVVLDPVMIASSGDRLLDPEAEAAVIELTRRADIITPNLPELSVLCGHEISTAEEALRAAELFASAHQTLVLVKGGHLHGDEAGNWLVGSAGVLTHASSKRIETKNTHGTGCSLSAAIATKLAQTGDAAAAVEWSTRWLHDAIASADQLQVGKGRGPIDHGVWLR